MPPLAFVSILDSGSESIPRSVTILIQKVKISAISLQSAISSSPRGVRSSYFTSDLLWRACYISGAQTCPAQRETQQLTSEVHEIRKIQIPPLEPPQGRHLASYRLSLHRRMHRVPRKRESEDFQKIHPCAETVCNSCNFNISRS